MRAVNVTNVEEKGEQRTEEKEGQVQERKRGRGKAERVEGGVREGVEVLKHEPGKFQTSGCGRDRVRSRRGERERENDKEGERNRDGYGLEPRFYVYRKVPRKSLDRFGHKDVQREHKERRYGKGR